MAIKFPPPPKKSSEAEWEQWVEILYRYVKGTLVTSGDANATISSGTTYHGVTALTAPRTLTLPDAALMTDGDRVEVRDESGSAGTHNITIVRAGTDTVNGISNAVISSNYGSRIFVKRGAGKWYSS